MTIKDLYVLSGGFTEDDNPFYEDEYIGEFERFRLTIRDIKENGDMMTVA